MNGCSDQVHRAELQLLRDIERHLTSGGTLDDFDDEIDGDGSVPVCRWCGRELTSNSELWDSTCTACFRRKAAA